MGVWKAGAGRHAEPVLSIVITLCLISLSDFQDLCHKSTLWPVVEQRDKLERWTLGRILAACRAQRCIFARNCRGQCRLTWTEDYSRRLPEAYLLHLEPLPRLLCDCRSSSRSNGLLSLRLASPPTSVNSFLSPPVAKRASWSAAGL